MSTCVQQSKQGAVFLWERLCYILSVIKRRLRWRSLYAQQRVKLQQEQDYETFLDVLALQQELQVMYPLEPYSDLT